MKILHTPARFYPHLGGTEAYAYYLCRELVRLGHDVTVVCAHEHLIKSAPMTETMSGITVKLLPYSFKVANTNITPGLFKTLIQEQFDIIHTQLPHPWCADISALVCLLKNKPLIITYQNDIVGRGFNAVIAWLYNHTLLKFTLAVARKIIITHARYLEYSKYLKPHAYKIEVVPIGVDLEKFKPKEG